MDIGNNFAAEMRDLRGRSTGNGLAPDIANALAGEHVGQAASIRSPAQKTIIKLDVAGNDLRFAPIDRP
jgi:hypothetical protein